MLQTIGNPFDKLLQRVKYRSSRYESPLTYKAINPLANISLAIEMVESRNTDPDLKFYIEIIKRNSSLINQLINEDLPAGAPFIFKARHPSIKGNQVSQDF
jgi:hypothetical protein